MASFEIPIKPLPLWMDCCGNSLKVFYVVKIGFSAAETLATLGLLRRFGYALNMDVKYNSLILQKSA